jgi:hypothetical protein
LGTLRLPRGERLRSVYLGQVKDWIWKELEQIIAPLCPIRFFSGLKDPELALYIREGRDFLYMDNAYFGRGPRSRAFRLVRGALHLTHLLDRPADRLARWGARCEPWRKSGTEVVVIPPSPYHAAFYGAEAWLTETVSKLKSCTERPIRVKYDKKEPLPPILANAWAVVTYGSVAGVEAALTGVPTFAGPICPTLPISAGPIECIDSPHYADREPWLASLTYANWSSDELDRINIKDYNYLCVS